MATQGLMVADSDMHVMEPPDLWLKYIDPRFRDRAPRGVTEVPRDIGIELDGKPIPEYSPEIRAMMRVNQAKLEDRYTVAEDRGFDAYSQVAAMDDEGVDVSVLFPSRGLFVLAVDGMEPDLAAAIARAYNDWLAEFCAFAPERLLGAAMLPPHDVQAAVAEARRAVKDFGFRAAFMRPNPINGHYWHDRYYDPLWAELETLGIPIGFHEGGSGRNPYIQQTGERFDKGFMRHAASHPMEMMQACIAVCMGGVLARFPGLRVAFLEGNCAWVPWLLWRMDEHAEVRGRQEAPDLTMAPSEYFRRQCFVSIECDETPGAHAVETLNGDNVVFSTDFPHVDSRYPHAVEELFRLPLPRDSLRKILWDNWSRLYGF
jgi:uncharacterized protein